MIARKTRPQGSARALLALLWRPPLWAVPFAVFFGTLYGAEWETYRLAYRVSLVFSYSIAVAMWAVSRFLEPRLERSTIAEPGRGARIGFTYVIAALLASYVAAAIVHLTLVPGFLGSPRAFAITTLYSLVFVGLVSGIQFAIVFYRQAVERARAVEQARRALAEAELRALRAQIRPHFLFNTLNSIASLISDDPAAAEDVTTRLAELFRYTLHASDREWSPLGEELEFVRNYLQIEHARFGDRLQVSESVEPGLEATPVPSLLLQPLVENAVHHAVSTSERGATVRIAARRDGDRLALEVADDGPGIAATAVPEGGGFGLHSVRERLRVLGPPHELSIESSPGLGTRVRIHVPLTRGRAPRDPSGDRP